MMFLDPLVNLFVLSFLAASLFPLGSEAYFLWLLKNDNHNVYVLLASATIGNSLGSFFTYCIGSYGRLEWAEKYLRISFQKVKQWKKKITSYGSVLAFFCWLPIVGDPLALALGYFKVPVKKIIVFLFLGKLVRYVFLTLVWNLD